MKYLRKAVHYHIQHPFKGWLILSAVMFLLLGLTGTWNIATAMGAAALFSLGSIPARREYRAQEARKSELDYLAKSIALEQDKLQHPEKYE